MEELHHTYQKKIEELDKHVQEMKSIVIGKKNSKKKNEKYIDYQ